MSTICGITFTGVRGTIQRPKAQIEHYTRLGDKRAWVQRLNTSSSVSELNAWYEASSTPDSEKHIQDVIEQIGIRGTATIETSDQQLNYPSVYIIDYTVSVKNYAGGRIVNQYVLQVITDERTQ